MADQPTQAPPAATATLSDEAMAAISAKIAAESAAAVKAGIAEVARSNQRQAEQAQRQKAQAEDPVAAAVLPVVAPFLRDIGIKADHGRDAAIFYSTTPEAGPYSGQIEARCSELTARGIPVDRHSVWNLIKGENLDSFIDKEIERRAQAVKDAEEARTIRGTRGGEPRGRVLDADTARTMGADDLAKALDGIAF